MSFFTYDLGSFQTAIFVLDPRASESAHKPFKSRISVLYSPVVPLDISLDGFLSQMFWELVSPVPRVGVPNVRQKPLTEEFHCETPPSGCYTGDGSFGKISASPTHLNDPFILCCGAVQLVLMFFSEGIVSHVAIDLLCLWEEVSSGSSCATIWNCLLFP